LNIKPEVIDNAYDFCIFMPVSPTFFEKNYYGFLSMKQLLELSDAIPFTFHHATELPVSHASLPEKSELLPDGITKKSELPDGTTQFIQVVQYPSKDRALQYSSDAKFTIEKINEQNCLVYACDTIPASSGSAVVTADLALVGLHKGTLYPKQQKNCAILLSDIYQQLTTVHAFCLVTTDCIYF